MADRDFDLRILKAGSHYLTDVRSPDGEEANHAFELPISPERLDELFRGLGHPRRATRGSGSPEVRQARDFGRQLFEAVFAGEIRDVFQRNLGRMEARGGDLRIRLRLTRDVPELLDLPWELLFDRGRNRCSSASIPCGLHRPCAFWLRSATQRRPATRHWMSSRSGRTSTRPCGRS
jgi:hypothetical protein